MCVSLAQQQGFSWALVVVVGFLDKQVVVVVGRREASLCARGGDRYEVLWEEEEEERSQRGRGGTQQESTDLMA